LKWWVFQKAIRRIVADHDIETGMAAGSLAGAGQQASQGGWIM
jgi:hypothetical protein